jgi:hypothetical protein
MVGSIDSFDHTSPDVSKSMTTKYDLFMKMLYARFREDSQPSAVTPEGLGCLRAQTLIKSTNFSLLFANHLKK